MEKIIKSYGNSLVIRISPDEAKIYGLEENDIVDVEIVKITDSKKRKKEDVK